VQDIAIYTYNRSLADSRIDYDLHRLASF